MSLTLPCKLIAVAFVTAGLSGCIETDSPASSSTPNAAEQACLAAVSNTTNNGDVVLLGSEFSQAGTLVRVGVGEQRAPWKCIAYADGTTAGVEYMGTNG
jgi:type IV pilus biogenesis protein CpaD/CtpE